MGHGQKWGPELPSLFHLMHVVYATHAHSRSTPHLRYFSPFQGSAFIVYYMAAMLVNFEAFCICAPHSTRMAGLNGLEGMFTKAASSTGLQQVSHKNTIVWSLFIPSISTISGRNTV